MILRLVLLTLWGSGLLACHSVHYVQVQDLSAFLAPVSPDVPPVSAHRAGGYYPGYPENALRSMRHLLRHTSSLLEVDVQMSADSVLFLLHDGELTRTTTGEGLAAEQSWAALRRLRLTDIEGEATQARIPRLNRVLHWARGKAILTLDVKRGIPWEMVIEAVREAEAENYVVLITYSLQEALSVHRLAPDLMLSVSISDQEILAAYLAAGLPADRLIAFTGLSPVSPAFLQRLHQAGIPAMMGTLGRLDQEIAATGTDSLYRVWRGEGVDIFATDRPLEVARALKEASSPAAAPVSGP
ncbi:MAG: glycerophosphodiester phosphodiesterase [Bacteroidetes bacterium]|nr:MAG: glycerophosphodiester phosphodiesterase [Bacteroidota bacterium]